MTISFYSNSLGAASDPFFQKHQLDSESLVIARIVESTTNSMGSNGGFLGRYESAHYVNHQFYLFEERTEPEGSFLTYPSSFGLQGYFYYALNRVLWSLGVKDPNERLNFLQLLTAFSLSFTLLIFICFSYKTYGLFAAIFTLATLSVSQWLVVFSNNLFWMFFLSLLPFTLVTYLLERAEREKQIIRHIYILSYFLILLKSLTGYEYISTILISTVAPIVFYSIRNRWRLKDTIERFILLSAAALAGFFSALTLHIMKLSHFLGSLREAVDSLNYTILKRTHGDPLTIAEAYRASLESSVFDVFKVYWNGTAFDTIRLINLPVNITFGGLTLLFILASAFCFIFDSKISDSVNMRRTHRATVALLCFSFMAPTSWLILAKGHSYIHTHINHIVWYIPYTLIGLAYTGYTIEMLSRKTLNYSQRTWGKS